MELTTSDRVLAAREAGAVQRCHTLPHHGAYTVGQHSYDALSLLLILHPGPSLDLVRAVLWHDAGERWVGDVPAPAKWRDAKLRSAYERAEQQALKRWDLHVCLGRSDQAWLHAVDAIEFLLWCQDQVHLGNQHAMVFMSNIQSHLEKRMDDLPPECQRFLVEHVWRRLREET